MLQVDPEADPLGQPVPLLQVREHRLAAPRVELRDPILLDLRLVVDAQLLFDRDLHRQPVAVPAALALHAIAAHRLKARVDVLEHAREHVVGARRAVRRRRALVEDPLWRALAAAQRLREHVALAPARQHLQLQRRQLLARIDLAGGDQRMSSGHRHGAPILGGPHAPPSAGTARGDAIGGHDSIGMRESRPVGDTLEHVYGRKAPRARSGRCPRYQKQSHVADSVILAS